jgi:hypothetical protein
MRLNQMPIKHDPKRWKDEQSSKVVQVAPEEGVRNLTKLILGDRFVIWFSFRTPVAFGVNGTEILMTKKQYSATTAAHKFFLKGKGGVREVPHTQFLNGLQNIMQSGVAAAAEVFN